MKKIICGILLLCAACKKQAADTGRMEPGWQELLNDSDRAVLDTLHPVLSRQGTKDFYIYPLRPRSVLLRMDSLGHFIKGRIISWQRNDRDRARFNGRIQIVSLQRALISELDIRDGMKVRKPAANESLAVPYDELPEVIVVAVRNTSGGLSYADYMCLQNLIDGSAGNAGNNGFTGGDQAIYSPIGAAESGGAAMGAGMGADPGGSPAPADILIQYETSYRNPPIDMDAWMNCFNAIPDAGAHFSVTLYCDIPVDGQPDEILNWFTGATGHVFMGLTKENAGQSITQIIGFTTMKAFSVFGTAENVPSKTVDNAGHGYDASYTIPLDAAGFNSVIQQAKFYSATMPYDIFHFNCIQYALGSINTAMGVTPIVIPPRYTPGYGEPINTPNGLYYWLEEMKAAAGPEASLIQFGYGLHAGSSHGPCN